MKNVMKRVQGRRGVKGRRGWAQDETHREWNVLGTRRVRDTREIAGRNAKMCRELTKMKTE